MPAATKYLLPCSCGRSIPIEISQAGQSVTCTCGQTIDVPAMRTIRTFATASPEGAAPQRKEAPAWSQLQGLLFAGGVLLALIMAALASYCGYIVSQVDVREPPVEWEVELMKEFDKVPIDQMYEVFREIQKEGIGPRQPPPHVMRQRFAKTYQQGMIGALIGVGAGLLIAGSSFVIKPKQS
ncbi:MAG TPA: hypothetical protein VL096_04595 [Pirellulaceae bacterium]|nr:hypothetical protein [Pirellulaceae bacterium]